MNLFKDSGKMQRDWQIAGWNVTPKIKQERERAQEIIMKKNQWRKPFL